MASHKEETSGSEESSLSESENLVPPNKKSISHQPVLFGSRRQDR